VQAQILAMASFEVNRYFTDGRW